MGRKKTVGKKKGRKSIFLPIFWVTIARPTVNKKWVEIPKSCQHKKQVTFFYENVPIDSTRRDLSKNSFLKHVF